MSLRIRTLHNGLVLAVAGGLLCLTGCPGDSAATKSNTTAPVKTQAHDDHDHDHDHDHEHHHHHHAEKGPHGGALVAIGQDDAHLEIVLDAATGTVTAYVLDGAAEKPVTIKQKHLQLAITLEEGHDHHGDEKKDDAAKKDDVPDDALQLLLAAVSPADDGSASEFSGQLDQLKGADEFDAALTHIKVGEKEFNGVTFNFPKGNEHDHHH
ncbi:MAG: hypothetical protein JSS02_04905 [Planctomycetes bacterium]|nr:hypothetical protein [Planctomycetota bacterium]